MINRDTVSGALSMDASKMTGVLVIGCVLALAFIRYTFEGRN